MSTKRQPSKQQRQAQNQKQRAALNARREAAATGRAPAGKVGGGRGTSAASRGSVLSRLRGASTTGRTSRTARAGTGGGRPVGHRAAMSALFAAIAGAVVGAVLFKVPVDRSGDAIVTREALVAEWVLSAHDAAQEAPEATPEQVADAVDDWTPGGSQPYVQAFWPISAAVLLPVLGTGLGFRAVSRRSPAKLVNRTMYVTLFGALLSSQLLLIFLPAVISLAVAAFQVRKAEVAATQVAATGVVDLAGEVDAASVDVVDADEIIEVDEVPSDEAGDVEDDEAPVEDPRS